MTKKKIDATKIRNVEAYDFRKASFNVGYKAREYFYWRDNKPKVRNFFRWLVGLEPHGAGLWCDIVSHGPEFSTSNKIYLGSIEEYNRKTGLNLILQDGKVLECPKVVIDLDKDTETLYFDTYEEAKQKRDNIIKDRDAILEEIERSREKYRIEI